MVYLWVKMLHLFFVISWMAGMLYLPRLFAYHTTVSEGNDEMYNTFLTMERRLMRIIMTPAMILSLIFGLWLIWELDGFSFGWMHAKFLFIFVLFGLHGFFVKCYKNFERKENTYSTKFFKMINEVPAVIMIFILILVVLKPF